ncbi:MAG TPA: GNAT family N-acetyltransferase [Edaphocola sp.]|nr:GNAT family N-acetyltransferase [Edaphocola sp.]
MNNQSRYRQLSDLHRRLPLFFQPWWLDTLSQHWDIALVETGKGVQAIMPFQLEKKWGLRLLRNPPLCPYLGPLFFTGPDQQKQWSEEDRLLETLLQQVPKWDYFQLTTVPGFQNFLPFYQRGFTNSNRLTYLLDLSQPEEALFGQISPRLRQYIKSAQKILHIEQQQPDVALFLSWHKKAFEKKGKPYPFSSPLIEKILTVAEQHRASLFQTAFNEQNQAVAMLWTPFDGQTSYHLLAATVPGPTHNGALALLTWSAIKSAKARGKKHYDFEGSMDKGIEAFFRKFGGRRVPYLQFEHCPSRLWQLKRSFWG